MKISKLLPLFTGIVLSATLSAYAAAGPQLDFTSLQANGNGDPTSAFGVVKGVNGSPLVSDNFTAQLWGSTVNDTTGFTLIASYTFGTSALVPSWAGQIVGSSASAPASFGQVLFYNIRAFDNTGGATTVAQAASQNKAYGTSAVASRTLGADSSAQPSDVSNFVSFSLAVPEPSVLALGLLGSAVLLFRRRK